MPTLAALGITAGVVCDTAPTYRVQEVGKTLEIETPDGKKVFFGNIGFDTSRDYRVVLPLDSLSDKAKVGPLPNKAAEEDPDRMLSSIEDPAEQETPNEAPKVPNAATAAAETPAFEYDDTDRLIVEANHFYNRRKFFEATLCVEELVRKKPEFARAWIMKGSLLHVQGHRDLARKAWEKALTLEPQNNQIKDYLERYK